MNKPNQANKEAAEKLKELLATLAEQDILLYKYIEKLTKRVNELEQLIKPPEGPLQ